MDRIEIELGDITLLEVDAIVNAANKTLLGGGGVDGAIHKAAGYKLLEECKTLNGCDTGDARITAGYNLKAEYVIHAVGPVWKGGSAGEAELLASCYRKCLEIASERKISQIAFPCISTGIYHYPQGDAAIIAVNTVRQYLRKNEYPKQVIFVCYNSESLSIYKTLLKK